MEYVQSSKTDKYMMVISKSRSKYNQLVLLVADTGGGKSVAQERLTEEFYKAGFKVVYVNDPKNEFEGAYAMFKPSNKEHVRFLEKQGDQPSAYPVRINHPLIRGIPRKDKLPEMNLFTISLKNIGSREIKFLLEREEEGITYHLIKNNLEELKVSDDVFTFLRDVKKSTERSEERTLTNLRKSLKKSSMGLRIDGGKVYNYEQIEAFFSDFVKHGFLTPENYRYNVDIVSLIKDKKTIDFFSTKWLGTDDKVKMFVWFHIFNTIVENLDKIDHPILLILPELKLTFPRESNAYQKIFSKLVRDSLATIRNKNGAVIGDTQISRDVDQRIIDGFNEILFGRLASASETDNYYTQLKMSRSDVHMLEDCPVGFFKLKGSFGYPPTRIFFPTHAHKYPSAHFLKVYEKNFPEKMKSYEGFLEVLRLDWESWKEKHFLFLEKELEEELRRKREKKKGHEEREEESKKEEIKKVEGKRFLVTQHKKDLIKNYAFKTDSTGKSYSRSRMKRLIKEEFNLVVSLNLINKVLEEEKKKREGLTPVQIMGSP